MTSSPQADSRFTTFGNQAVRADSWALGGRTWVGSIRVRDPFNAQDKGNFDPSPDQESAAVQLLLGHSKLESTMRYLGIEVDDALEMSEQTEI